MLSKRSVRCRSSDRERVESDERERDMRKIRLDGKGEMTCRTELTAAQFLSGVHAGIVPRETDEDGTAVFILHEGSNIGFDVFDAHG